MQQNARAGSSGGEDNLLAFGLILAVICGGAWFLWFRYHAQIAAVVIATQHWQMQQFSLLTDHYAELDHQVLLTPSGQVRFATLFRLCRNVGAFLRWPAVALTGVLAVLCLTRAASGQFTRDLDLDQLMLTQAAVFRTISPFVGRGLTLVPAADDVARPADPALHVREWVARFAAFPDGNLNEDAARAELSRQLGPVWAGVADAEPHVRCLFAAFVLHAARRREDALALLGDMAESLPIDTRDGPAGPPQSLADSVRARGGISLMEAV